MNILVRIIIINIIFFTGILQYKYARAKSCDLEVSDNHLVTNPDWNIEVRGYYCGFGISAGQDIVAVNSLTGETKILMVGDDVNYARVNVQDNSVIIKILNLTDIKVKDLGIPGHQVVVQYTPADDPEARNKYQAWLKNRADNELRIWYCSHVLSHMGEPVKSVINHNLTQGFIHSIDKNELYCVNEPSLSK